jgi:hypothetical protein
MGTCPPTLAKARLEFPSVFVFLWCQITLITGGHRWGGEKPWTKTE